MIAHILTVAVCLAVVLVFRQLDKNNRSLEKVKKFTDKIIADLGEYLKNRETQVKNAGVELDVKQSQAVAAVKRLEQNIAVFENRSAEFTKQTAVISELQKRIASYEQVIKELFEMTGKVEENLEKIYKHSAYVDKASKLLDEHQNRLTAIEKRIPDLILDFEKQNNAYMSRLGAEYTAALERRSADLQMLADSAVDKNQELLDEIKSVYEQSLSLAAEKADSLEGEIFEKLKENVAHRSEEFEQLLERSTQDLTDYIDREKEIIRSSLSNKIKDEQHSYDEMYEQFKNTAETALN